MDSTTTLAGIIRRHGPIPTVRVSSAQARGYAKRYSYWGAARYELRLAADGRVVHSAQERASSDRRSLRLAEDDADRIALEEGACRLQAIGGITPYEASDVLTWLSTQDSPAGRAARRALASARRAEGRQVVAKVAAGASGLPEEWLTPRQRERVLAERQRIEQVRRARRAHTATPPIEHPGEVLRRWRGITISQVVRRLPDGTVQGHYRVYRPEMSGPVEAYASRPYVRDLRHMPWRATPAARAEVKYCLLDRWLRHGDYILYRQQRSGEWAIRHRSQAPCARIETWVRRPTRAQIAAVIRAHRAGLPSRSQPDTLGWRAWAWDGERLVSPHQGTAWVDVDLHAEHWDDSDALRGVCGVHARRMPRDWRLAVWCDLGRQEGPGGYGATTVTGVVERYGRYLLGETGWRAETAVIRELLAPSETVAAALAEAYPSLRGHIHVREPQPEV